MAANSIQVINPGPTMGQAFGRGLENAFESYMGQQQEQQKQIQLEAALERASGISSNPNLSPLQRELSLYQALSSRPDIAKAISQSNLEREQFYNKQDITNRNTAQAQEEDQKRYDVIKGHFGEKAADIYRAAPEGGKTALLNALLEGAQRGVNFEDLLYQVNPESSAVRKDVVENTEPGLTTKQLEKPSFKTIDYDRGLTPKERVKRQDARYSQNLPLYQESHKKVQGLEAEKDSLDTLSELSPKIGAMQRLNINPVNGELLIPALASPDAQRFVKTVNDFTVKAKDSFGSRISNFELDRFMKRLPTLANSEEGRRGIIRQMQIINDINTVRERKLQQVIDEHGGIRNIDYDKAERIADNESKAEVEGLKKEFKAIEGGLEKQYHEKIKETKKALVPPGRVAVEKDGKFFSLPVKYLESAKKDGYKPI